MKTSKHWVFACFLNCSNRCSSQICYAVAAISMSILAIHRPPIQSRIGVAVAQPRPAGNCLYWPGRNSALFPQASSNPGLTSSSKLAANQPRTSLTESLNDLRHDVQMDSVNPARLKTPT